MTRTLVIILLFGLLFGAYYLGIIEDFNTDKTFITLSTFLFALFTGFFISRQAGRYADIRKLTASFDGHLSATYRAFGHFTGEAQKNAGAILEKHYGLILEHGWDYPLREKTTTLTDLHHVIDDAVAAEGTEGARAATIVRLITSLDGAQLDRKNMKALHQERIPYLQWLLLWILAAILVLTVSTLPSEGEIFESLIKAAFVLSTGMALFLLRELDTLKLFGSNIGSASAQDVLDTIQERK